jgi:NADH-quinone oxidoreductase subunit G
MERTKISVDNLSLERIESRCIHCGVCLKTCQNLNNLTDECVNCGQCILTCPTAALVPKYCYHKVLDYINDTDYCVVASIAPTSRVAISEEFGIEPNPNFEKKLIGILRKIGFDKVFDVSFGADLTIVEEATELINRLDTQNNLPLMTSCCPSWVNYVHFNMPEYIKNLSTVKSPIGIESIMIKKYYSKYMEIPENKIIHVTIVPCVSKKTEITLYDGCDFAITNTELAMMIRENDIDINNVKNSSYDSLVSASSSNGVSFGFSGGVAFSVLKTAYYMINKKNPPLSFIKPIDETDEHYKTYEINLEKYQIKGAVFNTLSTVEKHQKELNDFAMVEVMACPDGCIGGAGLSLTPVAKLPELRDKRRSSLATIASKRTIKESYVNKELQDSYRSFLDFNQIDLLHHKQ